MKLHPTDPKNDLIDMHLEDPWDSEYGQEQKAYVSVDGEYIPTDEVTFLDIEEDISGRDLMTFEYAGTIMKSFVIVK